MSHFTKSQIEEIRQRLATKAVRDSDLENASSFDGDDFTVIVQDGENKKLDVNAFRNELQNGPKGDPGEPGRGITNVTSQETVDHDIMVIFHYTDNTTSQIIIPSSGLDYDDLERLTDSEIETLLDL